VNSGRLPWADWAAEFREKLPAELEAFVQAKAAAAAGSDHSDSIRERLKSILDLFRVSRYRPSPAGTVSIDLSTASGGQLGEGGGHRTGTSSGASGGKGGKAGNISSVFEKKDGTPGQKVNADPFPRVKWISMAEGTRDPGDLEDRAARFIIDQNYLLINADFRVFNDMVTRFCKEYGPSESVGEVVREVVRSWFEQALV